MGHMNIDKRRARNSPSLVKYIQLTQVPKRSASKINRGVKHGLPCTGTFKELFRESNYMAGVLNMWRRHYGEVPFGSIVRRIVEL